MWYVGKKHVLCAAIVALALASATACSSSAGSAGSAGSATGGSSSPADSSITIGGSGPIASSVLSQPEREGAIEAAISTINAAGGVNGHPLKLDWCDSLYTAAGEEGCARTLVSDKVTAVITPGWIADQSGRGYQLLGAAGIPIIGGQGLTPQEFSTPGSFPMGSGIPGWAYGQVAELVKAGAKKIALFGTNEAGSQYMLGFTATAMKSAGLTPVRHTTVDPNADPTFASGATKVIEGGVDGVIFDASPTYSARAVTALRSAGYQGAIASISAIFPQPILQALGSSANNLYLSSQLALTTDTANPGVAAFLSAMKRYEPSSAINETSMTAWTGTQLFASAADRVKGAISAKSVLDVLNAVSTPIDLQTSAPYKTLGVKSPIAGYPRMFNQTIGFGVVNNGKLEPFGDEGFIDPFTTLAGLAAH